METYRMLEEDDNTNWHMNINHHALGILGNFSAKEQKKSKDIHHEHNYWYCDHILNAQTPVIYALWCLYFHEDAAYVIAI